MKFDMNFLGWTRDQWNAFGRHALTAVSTAIATALAFKFITPQQAADFTEQATTFVNAFTQFMMALGTLAGALAAIYAGIRAASTASPQAQAETVAKHLEAGDATVAEKAKVVEAVANLPEVTEVKLDASKVETPVIYNSTPENVVVQ